MNSVMLDLETFGVTPNAAVVQIGAIYFDEKTGETGEEFLRYVDVESELEGGFTMDVSTIHWWLQQDEDSRKGLIEEQGSNSTYSWLLLSEFLKRADRIWSHSTFDFVIMRNHFRKYKLKSPVSHRGARDLRTLVYLSGINPDDFTRVGTAHNAIDDCKFQINYTVEALSLLRN